jgi:hypothetical protein
MTTVCSRPARLAAVLLGLFTVSASWAEEYASQPRTPALPAYAEECGACHIAFPSYLLPAAAWTRLMGKLPSHYGSDASLDKPTTLAIASWLQAHAASGRRAQEQPADDRITRSNWFVREHDEVPGSAWTRASIKSAANCAACHTYAAQGQFNERDIRIPR